MGTGAPGCARTPNRATLAGGLTFVYRLTDEPTGGCEPESMADDAVGYLMHGGLPPLCDSPNLGVTSCKFKNCGSVPECIDLIYPPKEA